MSTAQVVLHLLGIASGSFLLGFAAGVTVQRFLGSGR
jgi:hypothetical protein